jgi:hypothetical protein
MRSGIVTSLLALIIAAGVGGYLLISSSPNRSSESSNGLVSIGELRNNPKEFVGKVVEVRGTIIYIHKENSLGRVVVTVYRIDDNTGYIDAAFRGDLQYSEQEKVIIKGIFKHEMPYWGPYAGPLIFIDIQE